ncbi:MAG TPA: VWA domain-containing protein [Solirubrobacteraceae bacterium]|nr:VWA domain-containing protein [Solirubrobacteraceae bacterium]
MAKRPEHVVSDAAVALGRGLREAGVATTVDAGLVLCRALGELDLRSRAHVYWAGRCTLVHHRDQVPVYDAVFERFWAGRAPNAPPALVEAAEGDPRMPGPQHGGDSLPQYRTDGRSSQLLDGERSRASREIPSAGSEEAAREEQRHARGLLAAYSAVEQLGDPEAMRYAEQELAAVRRLAEELRRSAPVRHSRRPAPVSRPGRLDLRATVRGSLRTDGEVLQLAFCDRSRRPRRLVVICDVSGSMERYSRALLGALEAVAGSGLKAETFVFATRLTRLTGPLAGHDAGRALAEARAAVPDWSGGTRIGPALAEFNERFARRGLARGAIAIVVSDGWDRGDPRLLARELATLRLQVRRLIWINPRPNEIDGQPFAVGMRTALPFVDDYLTGVDPRAMVDLGRVIAGLGSGRPARRQRTPAAR